MDGGQTGGRPLEWRPAPPARPARVLVLHFDGCAPRQGHFLPPTQRRLISTNCARPLPVAWDALLFADSPALALSDVHTNRQTNRQTDKQTYIQHCL